MSTFDQSWLNAHRAKMGLKPEPRAASHPLGATTKTRPKARGTRPPLRHEAGKMNGFEQSYAAYLDSLKFAGEIAEWRFEPLTLIVIEPKHERRIRYTPDFMVFRADWSIEFHETKGYMEDDARKSLFAASAQYPMFDFVKVTKHAGAWVRKKI